MTNNVPLAPNKVVPGGYLGVYRGHEIHAVVHGKEAVLTVYTAAGEQIPPVFTDYRTWPDGRAEKLVPTRKLDRAFFRETIVSALRCQWRVDAVSEGTLDCTLRNGSHAQFETLTHQGRVHEGWDRFDQLITLDFSEIDAVSVVEVEIGKRTGKRDPATTRTVYSWTRPSV